MMMQESPLMDNMNGQEHHNGLIDRRLVDTSAHMSSPHMPHHEEHLGQTHHHMAGAGSPPNIGMWPPGHLMMNEGGEGYGGHHPGIQHHPEIVGGSSASSSSGSSVGAGGCNRGSPPLLGQRKTTSTAASKKGSSRRNAWGNLSYADLITQAIQSAPEKRLTLSQVYEWMVANIPYFKDKGDSNSSAGWKNSIRHNLSLHSRFIRVQNEGTGKSSWWMLNPDAKPGGKSSRRRTPSVDGGGANGGINPRRRGRTKKAAEGAMRDAGLGNGSTPSPGIGPPAGIHGMVDMYEDNRNIHPPYPFASDIRHHIGAGNEYGGRMSPPPSVRDLPFGYPGQESWPAEYPQCGMQGYFPGNIPRNFCDQICPEGDYSCPRPGSPSALLQSRLNGYRHYQASNENNFHTFTDVKMPASPLVVQGQPQECAPHTYSNIQVMSPGVPPNVSPSCQRPGNFPSPDPPSQTPGEPPILSPHPLQHGQAFFPSMPGGKPPQSTSPQPPTTPTSKSCNNAPILERALGTSVKQEQQTPAQHIVTSAVMTATPGQWSHLSGPPHVGFSEPMDDFMKSEHGLENMEYMYHHGGPGSVQNSSPGMTHLPPTPHSAGPRAGEAGQYHHTLSNWVR